MLHWLLCAAVLALVACNDDSGGPLLPPPSPTCDPLAGGGSAAVAQPVQQQSFSDRWHEGWLASPAVADLDEDGTMEVIGARHGRVLIWSPSGQLIRSLELPGRVWASPVVADLVPSRPGLELAVAARGEIHAWDSAGDPLAGFPTSFNDELRSLAAGDIDGDGQLELVAVTTNPLVQGGQKDIIMAFNGDGSVVDGFPPNTSGSSGCDDHCYVTGGYDQNVALGDMDGDGKLDILATQDNAYLSLHAGDGRAFDAASIFDGRAKWPGIRFLHDYQLAQQGWAPDEESANQAHFTNSAPAMADVDGDGQPEAVVLGSVQNAAQTDRERGVGLWVLERDGTRSAGWETPFHAPDFLSGLWDFADTNVVGATNQVTVADIDDDAPGPELIFAGFDGRIHCVDARAKELWNYRFTTDDRVLTAGVAVADLSGDGAPEVVFATYSPDDDKSELLVLDGVGQLLHAVPLPGRGAMAVPTLADVRGDGSLQILVSLKGGDDGQPQLLSFAVPGAGSSCRLWPTGRGNLLRNGYVPARN